MPNWVELTTGSDFVGQLYDIDRLVRMWVAASGAPPWEVRGVGEDGVEHKLAGFFATPEEAKAAMLRLAAGLSLLEP